MHYFLERAHLFIATHCGLVPGLKTHLQPQHVKSLTSVSADRKRHTQFEEVFLTRAQRDRLNQGDVRQHTHMRRAPPPSSTALPSPSLLLLLLPPLLGPAKCMMMCAMPVLRTKALFSPLTLVVCISRLLWQCSSRSPSFSGRTPNTHTHTIYAVFTCCALCVCVSSWLANDDGGALQPLGGDVVVVAAASESPAAALAQDLSCFFFFCLTL